MTAQATLGSRDLYPKREYFLLDWLPYSYGGIVQNIIARIVARGHH